MTETECALCHQPIRSAAAKKRRIGSRCWRKLSPAQRAAIRRSPSNVRTALNTPVSDANGQLPIYPQENDQ
ncbi:hypothetical protein JL475_24460 [Streptomyces sp. M2CJ-2]|uniref:hypothetical protein n=1 Tax=Streptomyces sp. M2CJ-2 TaxID=2803948 RepID=UPI001926E079|nr:hypothetical protein [Streptomyces sp. M2CJ-2]MBL3669089.1 hypothetical protein [Streptomyces sp. M2CJ-2]